jgi:hypothetical protein
MSPIVITYIGFVVAILILTWGVMELTRRYWRRQRADTRSLDPDTWVPLKPTPADLLEGPALHADEVEGRALLERRTRAQQNGHYTESKKNL